MYYFQHDIQKGSKSMASGVKLEQQVFCMVCKKIIPISNAGTLLKTGYYQKDREYNQYYAIDFMIINDEYIHISSSFPPGEVKFG